MAKSDDLLKRIEALNGRPLQNKPDSGSDMEEVRRKIRQLKARQKAQETDPPSPQPPNAPPHRPIVSTRDVQLPERRPYESPTDSAAHVVLAEAVLGREIDAPHGGKAYLIEERVVEGRFKAASLCRKFRNEFDEPESSMMRRLTAICRAEHLRPEDLLVMDLETTGLSNSPVFLVGTMVWEDDGLVVRQFLARDYSEETAITSLFVQSMAGKKLLVTFNGKTFDLPFIRTRAAANAVPFCREPAHLDLLHESRKIWRGKLPDCKLQTLERYVCGVHRTDDIPGSQIPDAYHAFVRTSNAVQMVKILEHNALDLVTLADLMVRMP